MASAVNTIIRGEAAVLAYIESQWPVCIVVVLKRLTLQLSSLSFRLVTLFKPSLIVVMFSFSTLVITALLSAIASNAAPVIQERGRSIPE
jgi:cbb3-type cytochrome oxidase subunit 1